MPKICRLCLNSEASPSVRIGKDGLCGTCHAFKRGFDPKRLARERRYVEALAKGGAKALVGFSGGKDSTATLLVARALGFDVTAFTFDIGYYPPSVFTRAARIAKKLGVPHVRIDIRPYIRDVDKKCYRLMADLYDEPETPALAAKFRKLYAEGRKHYSIKCDHALPFVRTCQLCRRTVIRAYYGEAIKRDARVIILGMNEWAGLSKNGFCAIRTLEPSTAGQSPGRPTSVDIVHFPFLYQRKLSDTRRILKTIGWKLPPGEALVESNANSCLLARAAEAKAARLLGFHPDTTRLSREITAGFMPRGAAKKALAKTHRSKRSVRDVLEQAGIL